MANFYLNNGSGGVNISERYIYEAYMILIFVDMSEQKTLGDPQEVYIQNDKKIKVLKRLNKLFIIFTDGAGLEVCEDELRDFHYAIIKEILLLLKKDSFWK